MADPLTIMTVEAKAYGAFIERAELNQSRESFVEYTVLFVKGISQWELHQTFPVEFVHSWEKLSEWLAPHFRRAFGPRQKVVK